MAEHGESMRHGKHFAWLKDKRKVAGAAGLGALGLNYFFGLIVCPPLTVLGLAVATGASIFALPPDKKKGGHD